MAQEMTGLFGPSPYEVQQARNQQMNTSAENFAQMNATQRGVMGMYQGGAGLAGIGAGMMGMVDPAVEQAKRTEQIMGQGNEDMSSSAGWFAKAKKMLEAGDQRTAAMWLLKANQLKKQEDAESHANKKDDLAERRFKEAELAKIADKKQEVADKREMEWKIAKAKLEQDEREGKRDDETRKMIARMENAWKMATAEARKAATEAKSSGPAAKPKGLSREAGLAWELENGRIDQATYDAAMSATPAGKLRQQQQESLASAESGFNAIEQNIFKVYDPATKSLRPAAQDLFGKFAQYRPEALSSQETVNAKLALESLTDQVMMANLADAKKRVGQSFGSMQVQEWDKFTNQLTSLKRGLSEEAAAKAMRDVLNFVGTKRSVLNKALETTNTVQPKNASPAAKGASPSAPDDFNARWATLKSGQSLVGPDGKTYTKK